MGLDMMLSEGGAPLSAGQKQLIALARAVLRRAKVRLSGVCRLLSFDSFQRIMTSL